MTSLQYICVECGTESSSLYKQYSASSIKLTVCQKCQNNVDPYVERDWLLIVLDCLLLRLPAYRHVLYNVDLELDHPKRFIQFALASAILQAYQAWEGVRANTLRMAMQIRDDAFWFLLLSALVGLAIQWFCLHLQNRASASRLFAALVLPTTFSAVTNLVLVWENSVEVRLLGKALETLYQFVAVVGAADGDPFMFLVGIGLKQVMGTLVSNAAGLPCQITREGLNGFCIL